MLKCFQGSKVYKIYILERIMNDILFFIMSFVLELKIIKVNLNDENKYIFSYKNYLSFNSV